MKLAELNIAGDCGHVSPDDEAVVYTFAGFVFAVSSPKFDEDDTWILENFIGRITEYHEFKEYDGPVNAMCLECASKFVADKITDIIVDEYDYNIYIENLSVYIKNPMYPVNDENVMYWNGKEWEEIELTCYKTLKAIVKSVEEIDNPLQPDEPFCDEFGEELYEVLCSVSDYRPLTIPYPNDAYTWCTLADRKSDNTPVILQIEFFRSQLLCDPKYIAHPLNLYLSS